MENPGIICFMDWTLTIGSLSLGILDLAVLAILLVSAVSGCITGFARQLANVAGFVLSVPIALLFTRPIALTLSSNTGLAYFLSCLISFVLLSLLVFAIIGIFGSMLAKVLEIVPALNHILGFVWGLIVSAIVISFILAILNYQSFVDISAFTDSSIIIERMIKPLFPTILGAVR